MCLRTSYELAERGPRPGKRGSPASSSKAQKNSEKRKEKSRDAARCRRGKESEIFNELAAALPLPAQTIAQLDKASVMRLTIAYLKTRALCQAGFPKVCEAPSSSEGAKLGREMDATVMEALDGFLMVLSSDGDVVYTSENIVIFLGLSQVDVMGQSLYEYTHPCDHEEVKELVSCSKSSSSPEPRHAFLRLKCTLTTKGRNVNLKSATYKVVQVVGEVVRHEDHQSWLVALGTPVPHPSNIEFPLDKQTFVSKHALDMKFTYVDDNVGDFCGYHPDDLMGRSLYEMYHAQDSDRVKEAFKTLRVKGQVETGQYRFLARGGGYVWLVTQATLIQAPKDNKPQYVVCLNYVVSGVEARDQVLSEVQLVCNNNTSSKSLEAKCEVVSSPPRPSEALPALPALSAPVALPKLPQPKVVEPRVPPVAPPTPVATTFKIFTPLSEDMNKGYLTFSKDDPQTTVLKEEPEDLTHLAPSGGDTCVPLEVPVFDPGLNDMLTLDYASLQPTSANVFLATNLPDHNLHHNKFISDSKHNSKRSGGKVVLGDAHSPDPSCDAHALRTPSPPKPLLTQAALLPAQEKKYNFGAPTSQPITTTASFFSQLDESSNPATDYKMDLKVEEQNMDADEFDMRAPYIPLSNELLMLNPDDLLWGPDLEPAFSPKTSASFRDSKSFMLADKEYSSLAQLLRDTDPPMGCGADNCSGQYEQARLFDAGDSFVDPNKVLPGHGIGKDERPLRGGGRGKDDLPAALVQETVDPPPPLLTVDTSQVSMKRGHSPTASPLPSHKKLCSFSCRQKQQTACHGGGHEPLVQQAGGVGGGMRLLATPYAPTMQQLLVSKEPIAVRGRLAGGGLAGGGLAGGGLAGGSIAGGGPQQGGHSVLRNLLGVDGEGGVVGGEPQPGSSGLHTKSVLPRLVDGSATGCTPVFAPKLRFLTGGQGGALMSGGQLAFKVASSMAKPQDDNRTRLRRQDTVLLMDPDLTIPNLLDLTQLDYEVNAPAGTCNLLQGSDLLLALDQSP